MFARCGGGASAIHRLAPLHCCLSARWLSNVAEGSWPVVIVGGGPTGLTLSALLSKFGVPSLLLERSPALTEHPQAHYINTRTMEIFRHISDGSSVRGSLAQKVATASPPLEQWRKFVYCHSLAGQIYGEVDHFKGQTSSQQPLISPEGVAHLSQNRLLPMLLDSATAQKNVGEVLLGHQLKSFKPFADHIDLYVDGLQASFALSCKYLVAADGAASRIRKALGIPMLGQAALQRLVNIHFWAPSLARRLRNARPAMLYFVFNPKTVLVVVAHDLNEGEFVAQVPFFPPMQRLEQFTDDVCKGLLRQAAGDSDIHFVIKNVRSWTMNAQVAETFQAGNIFLAGDAAHSFPPAGGFGMNTGIQDAHNLAWKLAYVLGGTRLNTIAPEEPRPLAGKQLLESYSAERLPVAQANTKLSIANFNEAMRVPKALGLDPAAANLLSRTAAAAHDAIPGLGKRILEAGMAVGMAASGIEGPLKSWRVNNLKAIFDQGASLRLQFPKEDLGFTYTGQGAAALPTDEMKSWEWEANADGRMLEAREAPVDQDDHYPVRSQERGAPYKPSTHPGGRLPHVALRLMYSPIPSHSLLDLVGDQWAIVLSGTGSARVWSAAASKIRLEGFPLRIVHIIRSTQAGRELCHLLKKYPAGGSASKSEDAPSEVRNELQDSSQVKEKQSRRQREVSRLQKRTDLQVAWISNNDWARLRGVSEDGAILVRPDSHVAWRCVNGPPLSAASAGVNAAERRLRHVLDRLLFSNQLQN